MVISSEIFLVNFRKFLPYLAYFRFPKFLWLSKVNNVLVKIVSLHWFSRLTKRISVWYITLNQEFNKTILFLFYYDVFPIFCWLIGYANVKCLSDILNNLTSFPCGSWKDTFYPICTVPGAFAFEVRRATKRRSMGRGLICLSFFFSLFLKAIISFS